MAFDSTLSCPCPRPQPHARVAPRLDQIQDSHRLMQKLVEVLPVCLPDQQRQALGLLPEVAGEEDHASVLSCVEGLVQEDPTLLPAALEALANLSLDPDMQVLSWPRRQPAPGQSRAQLCPAAAAP